ncbi:MAG: hypothetical protein ACPLXC_00315 [Candidatus Pacearchaeota archaeon]
MTKITKTFLILPLFFISLLLINLASATIILSNVNPIYNLGDMIKLEAKVSRAEAFSGFFRIGLFCNNTETLMYFSPIDLVKNKEKAITVNFPVAKTGSCYISATLEDNYNTKIEETKTPTVSLSNKINIVLNVNQNEFEPKDKLELSGTATKENVQAASGIATITLSQGKDYSSSVPNGKISFSLDLPADIAPGQHQITVSIKDNNNNQGTAAINITILSVPTTLTIETNNDSFIPNSLLMITPKLLDQANNTLDATITTKLSRQVSLIKNEKLLEELIASGNNTVYRFTEFSPPGDYIIEASTSTSKGEFNSKKILKVEYYEKIKVDLQGDTLYISNIGNVPFKRAIEIEFMIENQSTKKVIDLDLKINENATFKLEAPKGTYTIKVNTGSEILEFKSVPLTGYVVATIELNKSQKLDFRGLVGLVALAVVLIVIMILLRTRRSHKEKKGIIKMMKNNGQEFPIAAHATTGNLIASAKLDHFASGDVTLKKIFLRHSSKLAADKIVSTIVYGTKQEITALFVHLGVDSLNEIKKKDSMTYAKILDEYFKEITQKIKEHQGVADLYDNNLIVLFNVIKQYRHDIAALKTAEAIKQITEELNRALAPKGVKIGVCAGINTGLANVTNIQNGTVKYTAIGNTTSLARALQAKACAGEILFTEKVYDRVANVIKARKMQPHYLSEQQAINIYSLQDGMKAELRNKNQWYIRRALGKG